MWFDSDAFRSFWHAAWSVPLRRVCVGISQQARTLADPDMPAPRWLIPLFMQAWIAQALAARAAWQQRRPEETPCYRLGASSAPCWSPTLTLLHEWRCLRGLEEMVLLWLFGMELERLYRISQTPPEEVGRDLWTQLALGACAHLTQVYKELKRRYQARRARERVRWALDLFITWRPDA